MKILVCFDGSAFSEKMLEFATKAFGGSAFGFLKKRNEITILHVGKKDVQSEYLKERIEEEIKALKEIEHKEWKEPYEEILERGRRILKKEGIEAKTKYREGDPVHEILEESHADYDLLVIGSHGAGGLSLFMGHTSQAVMKESHIPVIVIKPEL